MKFHSLFLCAATFSLVACQPKPMSEKVENKVNDALDRRPGEKVRDAAEDTRDAVKDAARDAKGAVKDATH